MTLRFNNHYYTAWYLCNMDLKRGLKLIIYYSRLYPLAFTDFDI